MIRLDKGFKDRVPLWYDMDVRVWYWKTQMCMERVPVP